MSTPLKGRRFLMLQGPQSRFFATLAKKLTEQGAECTKVQFCGGDVLLWGASPSVFFRGTADDWPDWLRRIFEDKAITDICLYGDCRPLHWEAVQLAEYRKIRVWVFEEGYIRNGYSTLEPHGVNGHSQLPRTRDRIEELARHLKDKAPVLTPNDIEDKVHQAIWHHTGNVLLWPVFFRYKTHRAMNIGQELIGILPRFLKRHTRRKTSENTLAHFNIRQHDYFFMPLQLNSDTQIQRYSPYSKMREAIVEVLSSFAAHSPKNVRLLIRNHPLDNGLIHYKEFVESLASHLGVRERIAFVEDGPTESMVKNARGVVLVNSTVGLMALEAGVPLFCLGQSVFDIEGLTQNAWRSDLNDFWTRPVAPNAKLYQAFKKVLKDRALIEGNFYTKEGIRIAVEAASSRFAKETAPIVSVQHRLALVNLREVKYLKGAAG